MESLSLREARRLALARAGLLGPEYTGLPASAGRGEKQARAAAHAVIRRFGYLQLDTVSIAGARSHSIVLTSRLAGFPAELGERLLQPGEPLFEYWGHEACWLPIELYPAMAFRREEFRVHPWWGDLLGEHPELAREILERIASEGPLRSMDLEGEGSGGWWGLKTTKKVISALWSSGDLAVAERRGFQRTFDLTERVIPEAWRRRPALPAREALKELVLLALSGHGWTDARTVNATWRLRYRTEEAASATAELVEEGRVLPCVLATEDGRKLKGHIRPGDLELAAKLGALRPRSGRGVLLSPFDPLLWDRRRVELFFCFEQRLEIFTPAERRVFGYFCLPILAGERLIGRVDLKADRRQGRLHVLARHFEADRPSATDQAAAQSALERYAGAVGLGLAP